MAHFYSYAHEPWIIESEEPRDDLLEHGWWREVSSDEAAGTLARAKADAEAKPEPKPSTRKPAAKADEAA